MEPARLLSVVADSVEGTQKNLQAQWTLVGFWGELDPQGACVLRGDGKGDHGLNDTSNSGYLEFLCITHFKNTMSLEHSFFNKVQR